MEMKSTETNSTNSIINLQMENSPSDTQMENSLNDFKTKTFKIPLNECHSLNFLHSDNKHKYLIKINAENWDFTNNSLKIYVNNVSASIEYKVKNNVMDINSSFSLCKNDSIMIKATQDNQLTTEFELSLTLTNFNFREYKIYLNNFYKIQKFYENEKIITKLNESVSKMLQIGKIEDIDNFKEESVTIPTKYISINPGFNQLFLYNEDILNFEFHITRERLLLLKEIYNFLSNSSQSIYEIIGPMGIGKSASLSLAAFYFKHCLKKNCFYFNFGRFKHQEVVMNGMLYEELLVFLYEKIKDNPEQNIFTLVEYLKEHLKTPFFENLVDISDMFGIETPIIILDQLNILQEDGLGKHGIYFLGMTLSIKKIYCNSNNNEHVRGRIEANLSEANLSEDNLIEEDNLSEDYVNTKWPLITKELNRCYSDKSFEKFIFSKKIHFPIDEGKDDILKIIKQHTNYNPFLYSQIIVDNRKQIEGDSVICKEDYLSFLEKECKKLFDEKCKKFYENLKEIEKEKFFEFVHHYLDGDNQIKSEDFKSYFSVYDCKLFYLQEGDKIIFSIKDVRDPKKMFYIKGICPYIKAYYCNLFLKHGEYLPFLKKIFSSFKTNPSEKGICYEKIFKEIVSLAIDEKKDFEIGKDFIFEISEKLTTYSFYSLKHEEITRINSLPLGKSIFISPLKINENFFDAYIIKKISENNNTKKFDLYMISITISDGHDIVTPHNLKTYGNILTKLNDKGILLENVFVYYLIDPDCNLKGGNEYGLIKMDINGVFTLEKKCVVNQIENIPIKRKNAEGVEAQESNIKNDKVYKEMKSLISKVDDDIKKEEIALALLKETLLKKKEDYTLFGSDDVSLKYYNIKEIENFLSKKSKRSPSNSRDKINK